MTYRTTISIPGHLKAQMDAIGDGVDWSAVAAAAFRAKVFDIQARKGKAMEMADVVKRLTATREAGTEDYDDGKQAGRQWAQSQATAKELQRLAVYVAACDSGRIPWWDADGSWDAPYDAADSLAMAIRPQAKGDQAAVDEFWEEVLAGEGMSRVKDSGFLRGFGEGAVAVWEEASNDL